MLAWAWRIASHRGLGSFAARLASTLAALPVIAAVAAALPIPNAASWPTTAGLGGAIGGMLAQVTHRLGAQPGRPGRRRRSPGASALRWRWR